MKFLSSFKRSFCHACYAFCIMTLLYSFIMFLIEKDAYISSLVVFLFWPFWFFVLFALDLVTKSRLYGSIRFLLHYAITMLSLWFFILYPHRSSFASGAGLIGIFAGATLLYIILAITRAIFAKKFGKNQKETEKKPYKNVYKK